MHHRLEDIKIGRWLVSKIASSIVQAISQFVGIYRGSSKPGIHVFRLSVTCLCPGWYIDRVGESTYVCVDADDVMRGHRHFHEEHVSMRFAYGNDLDFQCKDRSPPPPRAVTKWFNNEQSDQDSRSWRPRPMHFTIARACTADVDDATGWPDVPDRRPFPSSTLAASSINARDWDLATNKSGFWRSEQLLWNWVCDKI